MGSNKCPKCGAICGDFRNPFPTVDIIIHPGGDHFKVILIKRKNPPHGWALPGGFIDYGETAEAAAIREAKEETNLIIDGLYLVGVYSDPARDPRAHTMSIVYSASGFGEMKAKSDAVDISLVRVVDIIDINQNWELAFDHKKILWDYWLEHDHCD